MDRILAATSNAGLISILGARATRPRQVVAVGTLDELQSALEAGSPAVVVVDDTLDSAWELVRRVKVEGQNGECRTPVILLARAEPAQFEILPDERVPPPHDPQRVTAVCDEVIERCAGARRLFVQDVALEMATTAESIEKASEVFDALMSSTGFDDHAQVGLATTFREALGNAAEHGNKHNPERKIRVLYLRDSEKIAFSISDEGPGFNYEKALSRAAEVSALEHTRSRRSTEARPGGLGFFIMKKTCDLLDFNATGSTIYCMKYLPGRGKKAAAVV